MKNVITNESNSHAKILKISSLWLVWGWAGNCIWPAIHFDPKLRTLVIRINQFNECRVYLPMQLRNGKKRGFQWNWSLIARKFGKLQEYPGGDYYFYSGILGNHSDI